METFHKRLTTSLLLFLLIYLIFIYKPVLIFCLLILGILSNIEFFHIIKKITKLKILQFLFNLTFILYVFVFCLLFYILTNLFLFKTILFALLICCSASDIGGYIFGKIFKGPKLTKISPNKTISGAVGSVIFSILALTTLMFFLTKNININIFLTAIITSISCQIGDLFFSHLKRKAKVKDTGNFFPGHGGVLDRLDSIFFGVPVGFVFLILFFK